jgi:acetyl esterase/lipase
VDRALRLGLGVVASAVAVAVAARATMARRAAIGAVPEDLRHPILLLPLQVRSKRMLRLLRRIPMPRSPVAPGVRVEKRVVPGRDEHPPVGVYVYEPSRRQRPSGALLWIHGGGFVAGDPASYHRDCSRIAADLGIAVVSADYRLAPEHPFPAGLEDCYTALAWLHRGAAELGVDPDRIAIGGDSAGGGLSASLAQMAYDRGDVPVRFQLLVYPMLDDRTVLRTEHAGTGLFVWTPASNRFGWTAYLGHEPQADEPRPYAAPARRADLAGLPPAWIGVGDIDLFHAEDVTYAQRLTAAGVPCELVVVPGMYHGADGFFDGRAASMTEFRAGLVAALGRALGAESRT